MRNPFFALLPFLLATLSPLLPAQDFDPFADLGGGDSTSTKSETFSTSKAITPGQSFEVALKLTHPEGWHSYFQNPGIGIPSLIPSITWVLPEGFVAGDLQWPNPHRSDFVGLKSQGYEGTHYFVTTITAPDSVTVGETIKIAGDAEWQMCKESCINEKTSFTVELAVRDTASADDARTAELTKYAKEHLPAPTPEAWDVSASDDGDTLTLTISNAGALPKGLFLFDNDGQVDAQVEQTFVQNADESWTLEVQRNKGNQLSDTVGPVLPTLNGILTAEEEIPGTGRHGVNLEVAFNGGSITPDPPTNEKTTKESQSLLKILGLAFIGGLILNLMPCVFPVLGLKVMGFVQQAGDDPARVKKHGLVFAAGLLISLWILAAILILLVTVGGQYLGWGFQLNDPRFLAVMILIFFVMGLNLSGVFEFGTSMTGAGGALVHKKGYTNSFFSGILTTLVATPCTGPFLGVAMTFALQEPPHISFLVFTFLGLGIASPYLVLSFSPKLLNKLPRPGMWMETFKKALAFPLYLAVVYFMNGFGSQTGRSGIVWLLTALVVIAIALWIFAHWCPPFRSKRSRRLGAVMAILVGAGGLYLTAHAVGRSNDNDGSETLHMGNFPATAWEPGIVEKLQSEGYIVYMDYTADT